MDNRKLGQLEVSPIGMGCMGFSHGYGQVPPKAYAIEAIRKAYDYGCTHFDTAEAYGKEQFYAGHNEELVGKAIEPFRKEVVLATKFHIGELSQPDETSLYREVRRHLEDSMSRLRTDYIDLYYLHRINETVRLEDVAIVMGRLVKEGLIRGWGLSQVSADQIRAAHEITPLSAVQNIYSMVERDCETEIFPVCLEKGIGVVPFSPIASGFLSGKVTAQEQFGFDDVRKFVPQLSKENIEANRYLFCGPRGVGKTTCARIFAKTINCMTPTADGEACNECESCVAFNEQRSYNIHELDAASNNSVDDIRQLVEQVRIPPQIGKYKVYIIDEVHMLSASAFNAFLKTLEEPPRHAIFILATTEKHKILPTILSRCQIYDFNRISVEDTVNHLSYVAAKENITAEPEALNVIAMKADGGMRDALSIFDQVVSFTGGNITYKSVIENLNVLDYEYYFRLTDCFLENRVSDALLLFNDVLNKGFDGSHFITGLSSHCRDLLVSKDAATLPLLEVGASIRQRYQAQAQKCPLQFLYRAMKLCNDCDLNYRASKNKRLLVELTLIQVAQLTTEGDDVSGGRGPKQTIKPVFTQPAAAQQPQVASAPSAQQTTVHTAPSPAIAPSAANTAVRQPQVSVASGLLLRQILLPRRHRVLESLRFPKRNGRFL